MNVNIYLKGAYEEIHVLKATENKANIKVHSS
jgi:hypothetical protein